MGSAMGESHNASSGGIGFFGLLAIVFITLKLAEIGPVAHWSWWAVLAPIWAPIALVLVILLIVGIVALIKS